VRNRFRDPPSYVYDLEVGKPLFKRLAQRCCNAIAQLQEAIHAKLRVPLG